MFNLHYLELRIIFFFPKVGLAPNQIHFTDQMHKSETLISHALLHSQSVLDSNRFPDIPGDNSAGSLTFLLIYPRAAKATDGTRYMFIDSQGFAAPQPIPATTLYHLHIWPGINRSDVCDGPCGHSALPRSSGEFQGNSDKTQHKNCPDTPDLAKLAVLPGNFNSTSGDPNHILSLKKINKLVAWSDP